MIDVEMLRPTADEMLSGLTAGESLRKKVLLKAKGAEQLSGIAGEMLGGLHATPALRHRILVRAEHAKENALPAPVAAPRRAPSIRRLAPVLSMGLMLTLMIGLGAMYGKDMQGIIGPGAKPGMNTYAAGVEASGGGAAYKSIFAEQGENPPLIVMNGRYYRMLTTPMPVPSSLRGTNITKMVTFTEEPSLVNAVGMYSNIVTPGTDIYEVQGLSFKTACAAEVDGVLRIFQRVGYAGEALVGDESLEDTLSVTGQVASLELSGVGVITDEAIASELIYQLFEFGVYSGSEISQGDQVLTIYLKNGVSLQLMVQDDLVGACGAWACPEFFTQFAEYVGK